MKCRNCGMEYEGNFCPNCGAQNALICSVCGNKLINNMSFCANCGTRVANKPIATQPVSIQVQPAPSLSPEPVEEPKKFRTGMKVWMIIFFVFAGIFTLLAFAAPGLFSVVFFFLTLGVMFLLLGLSPRKTKYMFGKTCGLRKGLFVAICISVAYIGLIAIIFLVPSTEETTANSGTSQSQSSVSDSTTPTEAKEHKHEWVKATCEVPKTCKGCGETKDVALGHTTDCGICTRCDKEFRKKSPVTILNWTHEIGFFGGADWSLRIKNNTNKQIKYITLEWDCYNAVGDLVENELGFGSYVEVKLTGPIDAHTTSSTYSDLGSFYNDDLNNYKMTKIVVEYMDGTVEEVTEYHDNVIE